MSQLFLDGTSNRAAPQGKDNILSSMSFGGSAQKKNEKIENKNAQQFKTSS